MNDQAWYIILGFFLDCSARQRAMSTSSCAPCRQVLNRKWRIQIWCAMFEFCSTRRRTARLLADHISLNEILGMIYDLFYIENLTNYTFWHVFLWWWHHKKLLKWIFVKSFCGECEARQHTRSSNTDAPCRRTHLQLVKQKNVYYHWNMYIYSSQVHRFDSVMYAQLDATRILQDILMQLFVTNWVIW